MEPHTGPFLFEFQRHGMSSEEFYSRLNTFFDQLPKDFRYAVEIRNAGLLGPDYRKVLEHHAVVARRVIVDEQDNPALAAWYRNRAGSLVGFRLDDRGRLVGESWVPGAGLTADEFLVYLRGIAAACDLFEFQLTGKDKE